MRSQLVCFFSLVAAVSFLVTGCAQLPADDAKVKDLAPEQVQALCADACADAEPWEFECEQQGDNGTTTITFASDSDAEACAEECGKFESTTDECELTAGSMRTLYSKPADCDAAEERTGIAFSSLNCIET